MTYKHIFEPRALQEYERAVYWYLERSEPAARKFEAEVNKKLAKICSNPQLYHIVKKHFRETIIGGYPYSIIFFTDDETQTAIIVSIFHNKRNPKNKIQRIK